MTDPLLHRPRRSRRTPALRRMVASSRLHPANLILPVFVKEGIAEPQPVASMPGVVRHTRDSLRKTAAAAAQAGIGGLIIFGVPRADRKDALGSQAWAVDGITQQAIADVVTEVGEDLVVIADLNPDEATDHGNVGVLGADGDVDNDATLTLYAQIAVAQAQAGAHMVAPSGMMDGQVAAIRRALDEAGHTITSIMAYSAKYASALYSPFREAVSSSLVGNRGSHQQDPAGPIHEALREVRLDLDQGVDAVIIKPAMFYQDIVHAVRPIVDVPLAAYQTSGEYAMVEAAAARGWLDREKIVRESVLGIRRAGADLVITYWAAEVARWVET
ncbi:porphobilinogen synthase [Nonomuraea sp. KM90]|uniref:porphobilinogen synthase n=1 Tax=Nonomuraea sp. KM90 TaxID=3457428 RepID=UPI003FCCBED7